MSVHRTCPRLFAVALVGGVAAAAAGGSAGSMTSRGTVTFVAAAPWSSITAICGAAFGEVRVVRPWNTYVGHRWHPRGGSVAVVRRNGRTWTLEVMRSDGARRRPLASGRIRSDVYPLGEPAWSPTGDRIAFIGDGSLFVVRPEGRELRRVLPNTPGSPPSYYEEPRWSPDGERIFAFRVDWGPFMVRLVSVRPDGSDVRREPYRGEFSHGVYSPDGTQVAWVELPERTIHIAAADGTAGRIVVPSVPWRLAARPVWSPDGSALAYIRHGPGLATDVFSADSVTAVERRVTTNALIERDVAWHPGTPRGYGRCRG